MKKNLNFLLTILFLFVLCFNLTTFSTDYWQEIQYDPDSNEDYSAIGISEWLLYEAIAVSTKGQILFNDDYWYDDWTEIFDVTPLYDVANVGLYWLAVGRDGKIFKLNNFYGWEYTQMKPTSQHLHCIIWLGGRVLVGGDKGTLLISDDYGDSWRMKQLNPKTARIGGFASGSGMIALQNSASQVWTSNDEGETWIRKAGLSNPTTCISWGVNINGGGSIWLLGGRDNSEGNTAAIWRSTDNCNTWTKMTVPNKSGYVYDIKFSGHNEFIAVGGGWDRFVFKSTDNGITWTNEYTPSAIPKSVCYTECNILAVGRHKLIIKGED